MKKLLTVSAGLVLAVGLAYGMNLPFGTGDSALDSTLGKLNIAANADPGAFLRRLSATSRFPELQLRQARDAFGLGGADLFMATSLARQSHHPVYYVAEQYNRNSGKGWGVMAKNLGIKPGSSQFHRMKRDASGSLGYMQSSAKSKQKHEQSKKNGSHGNVNGNSHGKPKS